METIWVLAGAVLIVAAFAALGCYKGFVRMVFSFASFFLTIFLVTMIYPHVSNYMGNTDIMQQINDRCVKYVNTELTEKLVSDPKGGEPQRIEALGNELLNDSWLSIVGKYAEKAKEGIADFKIETVSDISTWLGGSLAELILKVIAFAITYAVISFLLHIIYSLLKVVTMLPVIHTLNKTLGGLLGILEGIIVIWVIMLIAVAFFNTTFGYYILKAVGENDLFGKLYYANPLIWLFVR